MFVLVKLSDTVRLRPEDLGREEEDAVQDLLNAKYANKVLREQGLCICVHDLTVLHNFLYPGDGGSHIRVEFQLIVFRPSPGEIIVGKVRQCDISGLYVSLDFFDHVVIPKARMQQPSYFDEEEKVWVWNFEGKNKLFMDLDQPLRFRVEKVLYAESASQIDIVPEEAAAAAAAAGTGAAAAGAPGVPTLKDEVKEGALLLKDESADGASSNDANAAATANTATAADADPDIATLSEKVQAISTAGKSIATFKQPMLIVGSIQDDGLGILEWWT